MKKHVFLSFVLILSFVFVSAQTTDALLEKSIYIEKKMSDAEKAIHFLSATDDTFREEIGCFISVDSSNYSGEMLPSDSSIITFDITDDYRTMEVENWKYNTDSSFYIFDGISKIFGISEFIDSEDDFSAIGDSALVYQWDDETNSLVASAKLINIKENGLIQSSTFLFGNDNDGYITFVESFYYYDNDDFLVATSTYGLNFINFTFGPADSTIYNNNAAGKPLEEIEWDWNAADTAWTYYEKRVHHYDAQGLLSYTDIFERDEEIWSQSEKETFTYDGQNRLILRLLEETDDNGMTFVENEKDFTIYTSNFDFNLPDRIYHQDFIGDVWVTSNISVFRNCNPASIHELQTIGLNAWFSGDKIYFTNKGDVFKNGLINLFTIDGKQLYQAKFDEMPEYITISDLNRGIYFLSISDNEKRGMAKLVK